MNKLSVSGTEYTFDGFLELFDLLPVVEARNDANYRNLAIIETQDGLFLGFETKGGGVFMIGVLDELVPEIKLIKE